MNTPTLSAKPTVSAPFMSSTISIPSTSTVRYSINVLQDEARDLVEKGVISRQQPIYVLCQYIPARDWVCVECELERCNFLLRDRIADLMGSEVWDND
jgi:hypothetical protein